MNNYHGILLLCILVIVITKHTYYTIAIADFVYHSIAINLWCMNIFSKQCVVIMYLLNKSNVSIWNLISTAMKYFQKYMWKVTQFIRV
jgi:hypothetical protein